MRVPCPPCSPRLDKRFGALRIKAAPAINNTPPKSRFARCLKKLAWTVLIATAIALPVRQCIAMPVRVPTGKRSAGTAQGLPCACVSARVARDKNRAKLPHKSSAARTSDLPRAQAAGRAHRMPGRAHKSSDARTDRRDARTDSQDCRTVSGMSAQVAGRAHSPAGPSVLVVCRAHRFWDARTSSRTRAQIV